MFFKEGMREAILDGLKTETRRIWKYPHVKPDGIYKVRRSWYSKDYYFKIQVQDIYKQRLGDMTEADAEAEGFESEIDGDGITISSGLSKFRVYWRELHGEWKRDQEVHVVVFRLWYIPS